MAVFHFLVEEEFGTNNNFTIYIPELRMSAVGDTLEEAEENAKDVIRASYETLALPTYYKSDVKSIELDLPMIDNSTTLSKAI